MNELQELVNTVYSPVKQGRLSFSNYKYQIGETFELFFRSALDGDSVEVVTFHGYFTSQGNELVALFSQVDEDDKEYYWLAVRNNRKRWTSINSSSTLFPCERS